MSSPPSSAPRKSIFITGAASGIGLETAQYFAKRGWFVGLFDVNEAGLASARNQIGPRSCIAGRLDVRDRQAWQTAVSAFMAVAGRMDVLFNNAGIGRGGWFDEVRPDDHDLLVDVNLKGVIYGVEAALPYLRTTAGARIINTSSASAIYGAPQMAVYSATKFAVRGLTEALDLELGPQGIRVTSLMPYFIDTPILGVGTMAKSNEAVVDRLRAAKVDVYPVSMIGPKVWEAAHTKAVHVTVGKAADRMQAMARFFPNALRRVIGRTVPKRAG
jgi:NAD(P)-dependent dehydrogenase (short-subunit alcohol dehydrogenase family)